MPDPGDVALLRLLLRTMHLPRIHQKTLYGSECKVCPRGCQTSWLKLFRCLFPGKVMLSRSRLDVVSWIRLEFMFTYHATFTSDASNATTTRYHYTRERSGETTSHTISTHSRVFLTYTWETIGSGNDVLYSNIAAPFSSVSWRKAIGCEKFQTNKEISANFRFSAQYFFSKIFWGGQLPPPCPSASYGLDNYT